jgi:aminopeptidase N
MAFKNHDSYQLRDSFSKYTGIDLHDFFNEWVFQAGFPHFEIMKSEYNKIKSEYTVTIKQRSRFNSNLYHNVPLIVTFFNDSFIRFDSKIIFSGSESTFVIKTPWQAALISLNADLDISEAITKYYNELSTATTYILNDVLMDITVKSIPSKTFIMVEHHWIGPEHNLSNTKGIRFSDYRYWTINGIFPSGFQADVSIKYNGIEGTTRDGSNYLDHTLNIQNEDSIVLLYRPDKLSAWSIDSFYTVYPSINKADKKGLIRIKNLKKGDYCIGLYDFSAGIRINKPSNGIRIYPNPGKSELVIDLSSSPIIFKTIRLIDTTGKIQFTKTINNQMIIKIETNNFKSGLYFVEIATTNEKITEKVVIE